ncbi:MAG: alpha/beta hydrolase, partial [Pseudomonadota bacterium]
ALPTASASAMGKALGERVIVMGTSTGASLAALAAGNLGDDPRIAGYVLVSPNFGVKAAGSGLLTLPMARWWLPAVLGPERSWTPQNEAHAAGWTTAYPTEALAPMAGVAADALMMPYDLISAPVLFAFSDEDEVVDPARTREVAERWGGIPTIAVMGPGEGGDPQSHVIAGDALSPAGTAPLVQAVLDWVEARELT